MAIDSAAPVQRSGRLPWATGQGSCWSSPSRSVKIMSHLCTGCRNLVNNASMPRSRCIINDTKQTTQHGYVIVWRTYALLPSMAFSASNIIPSHTAAGLQYSSDLLAETWWTEPSTWRISDHSKLRLVGECDDVHIARSSTQKNVCRRRRGSWQRSSMSLSSAVPAWFPVSGHDLLQTAGLRSCSAITSWTDPVLALRARRHKSMLDWLTVNA